ncbi:MAG: chemotaxis protein CheX [Polyangiaceae bacterium]|jgi:CheY-specific phosphatase CheX
MKTVLSDLLKDAAPRAVVDVFESYGVRLKERPNPPPTPALVQEAAGGAAIVAGVVGFNGSELRGTVLLATTFELAAMARPANLRKKPLSTNSAVDWIFIRDWVGELSNQTIGRMKNKVSRFGVAFDVSPPAAFSGCALTFALPKSPAVQHFAFTVDGGTVWLCLDAFFDNARALTAGSPDASIAEGKVVVFE